jgi:hypothetical protein
VHIHRICDRNRWIIKKLLFQSSNKVLWPVDYISSKIIDQKHLISVYCFYPSDYIVCLNCIFFLNWVFLDCISLVSTASRLINQKRQQQVQKEKKYFFVVLNGFFWENLYMFELQGLLKKKKFLRTTGLIVSL